MVCCVCLLERHNVMSIFDYLGEQLNIAETIKIHFWFKPQRSNQLTTQICTICWHKIDDFHVFYQTVEKAHKDFQKIHQKETAIIKEEDNPCLSTIKQEPDEEVFEDNLMQIEVQINNEKEDFQINPLEHDQNDSDDVWVNESDSSENYEPSEISEQHSSNEDIKTENKNISKKWKSKKVKDKYNDKKRNKRKDDIKKDKNENSDSSKKKKILNRLDPVLTEEMILKHIPMGCSLCVFVGKTFHDIVEHFKKCHPNVRAYITCCDKKFTKRYYVAQHAMNHENPDSFRCEECSKSFKTVNNLQRHNLISHAPVEECTFVCDLCQMKFARQHLLQSHKASHIPRDQWEFFCAKCPKKKAFASERLLNMHDINMHKTATHICNVCAKEIKNKKVFEKHLRSHYQNNGPRIKCTLDNCDSWLKDEDSLKKHIRVTHNITNKQYKCPECGKECSNQRALYGHRTYVHSNEVFKCEQCDKSFKKAISLREHMAHHTGEILYNCPFCPRTFNSNSNMHNHKKNQHRLEWEEARRKKGVGGS